MEYSISANDHQEKLKPTTVINPLAPLRRKPLHNGSSSIELMLTIPESHEADLSNPYTIDGDAPLLRSTSDATTPTSIVRNLTKHLHSPLTSRPSSSRRSFMSSPSFRSPVRPKSKNGDYSTVDGEDVADFMPMVDLSSLGPSLGQMGYEIKEFNQASSGPWTDQDTTYFSPASTVDPAPTLQPSASRKRTIGDGMENRIRIQRNSSILAQESSTAQTSSAEPSVQRAHTVRNIGQQVAQQQGRIVAISEQVDLSVLEGQHMSATSTSPPHGFSTSARVGTFNEVPQSFYFPEDPDVPNWKPLSMRMPFILSLIGLAFGLAGLQEYLCQWSFRKQAEDSGILAFNSVTDISVGNFFAWKYLPTMVTIVYAVMFSIMDFDIRRLEPYYQLSQKQGATAASSLNLDHLTMFQYFVPLKAVHLRQWAVAFSTFGNIIASTVAPALQNPSINFMQNPALECADVDRGCTNGQFLYFVRVSPVWSRLLTASYIVVGMVGMVLFFQLRRKSGLLSDPKGIAGIASMATKSHILYDFKGSDVSTRGEIHKRLAHRRFVLYQSSIWQGEWNARSEPAQESENRLKSPHPPMLRLTAGCIFVGVMVCCLAAVPIISMTSWGNTVPNQLPWLPILIATLLKLTWSTFESDVRLIEPFYQLSKGHAKPENSLTLDYQATVYGFMPFIAIWKGHYLVATVGVCSVALDVLSVTVSSFSVNGPFFITNDRHNISNGDETSTSFFTSIVLSMVILIFVIFTTCLVYARRRHPFLPREPSTIAAVLGFIYASKMLDDFIDTERLTNREMEKKLKATGKRYGLGWFIGRDGQVHCGIDQENIKSRYRHGMRYDRALAGPIDQGYV